jgi:acetylornithine deacetylase/succinyl-diaminopimelate desuccinylase-like protein
MKSLVEKYASTLNWNWLPRLSNWVIEQGIAVQQIPAPTFQERPRAEYVTGQFARLGLADIEIDDMHNVYGRMAGANTNSLSAALMISAHTDTIFAADTDLTVRRENDLIYAPGLGDNSLGVSGMLGLAYFLREANITPPCDLWFVATSREEGLGDLGGMRAAFARLQPLIGAVINLEGLAFGHIYHAGIAVRRLNITATGEGGHSWLHFGRPSAVHAIAELGAHIASIRPPTIPRTTFNIGMISGGEAINAIATHADLWLDLRSEERAALNKIEALVRAHVESLNSPELTFQIDVVGDRPAGYLNPAHPLVKGALAALGHVAPHPSLETGSTDANIPLSEGCPAVTIGITRGGNAHRLDEYIEIEPVALGMKQLIMLTLAAAEYQTNSTANTSAKADDITPKAVK